MSSPRDQVPYSGCSAQVLSHALDHLLEPRLPLTRHDCTIARELHKLRTNERPTLVNAATPDRLRFSTFGEHPHGLVSLSPTLTLTIPISSDCFSVVLGPALWSIDRKHKTIGTNGKPLTFQYGWRNYSTRPKRDSISGYGESKIRVSD